MTPLFVSILAIGLIFIGTIAGSSAVFFTKGEMSKKFKTIILGLGTGIMLGCSVFGLTLEGIETSEAIYEGAMVAVPVGVGFTVGVLTLVLFGKVAKSIAKNNKRDLSAEGMKMFFAVAVHNIPEGLGVGFVCGAAFATGDAGAIAAALSVSVALTIHNFVQGTTISLSMYGLGTSKKNAFIAMSITAVIETTFAIVGIFVAQALTGLMPWMLAFAGGAMTYIAIEDLYPDALEGGKHNLAVLSFFIAFIVMMMFELIF